MIVLDTTIATVALPSIPRGPGLHARRRLAWLVNALPPHVRRLPAPRRPARRPVRPPADCPRRGDAVHARLGRRAGSPRAQGRLVSARAVQGLGGAVVSPVALRRSWGSSPSPRSVPGAWAGFGFVMRGRREPRRACSAESTDERPRLALDRQRPPPDRHRGDRALAEAGARTRAARHRPDRVDVAGRDHRHPSALMLGGLWLPP